MEVLQILNAHCFEKENKSIQGDLVFGLPVKGRHAIFIAQIQMRRKCFFLIINLLTVIQWVNTDCRCFKNWNNPTQVFFFKASALWADAFYKLKCPSVCPSVRLSVCLFTFEVPFNGLFAPTSQSRMSNIFRDSESLGKEVV